MKQTVGLKQAPDIFPTVKIPAVIPPDIANSPISLLSAHCPTAIEIKTKWLENISSAKKL